MMSEIRPSIGPIRRSVLRIFDFLTKTYQFRLCPIITELYFFFRCCPFALNLNGDRIFTARYDDGDRLCFTHDIHCAVVVYELVPWITTAS